MKGRAFRAAEDMESVRQEIIKFGDGKLFDPET
jgi:hypothetical protein